MRAILSLSILMFALSFSFCQGEETKTFYLTVNSPTVGCRVIIDGSDLGVTPLVTQLKATSFEILVTSPSGKNRLKSAVKNVTEDRIIILADFGKKKIQVFRTQTEIVEYVDYEARITKFRKHLSKAMDFYRKKELMEALVELDSALESFDDEDARAMLLDLRKELLPSGFAYIEGGQFKMGSNRSDLPPLSYPEHSVIVSDFGISAYEITNGEFAQFIQETSYRTTTETTGSVVYFDSVDKQWRFVENPSWRQPLGKGKSYVSRCDLPVCMISWNDAVAYAKWINGKLGSDAYEIRLPTEAEWEYVASLAGKAEFPWGSSPAKPDDLAVLGSSWYLKGGSFPKGASPQGVYDLIGNLWEWTMDVADDQFYANCLKAGIVVDPAGPLTGDFRVARGGGYDSDASVNARTRRFLYEDFAASDIGIRLVISYKNKITSCE